MIVKGVPTWALAGIVGLSLGSADDLVPSGPGTRPGGVLADHRLAGDDVGEAASVRRQDRPRRTQRRLARPARHGPRWRELTAPAFLGAHLLDPLLKRDAPAVRVWDADRITVIDLAVVHKGGADRRAVWKASVRDCLGHRGFDGRRFVQIAGCHCGFSLRCRQLTMHRTYSTRSDPSFTGSMDTKGSHRPSTNSSHMRIRYALPSWKVMLGSDILKLSCGFVILVSGQQRWNASRLLACGRLPLWRLLQREHVGESVRDVPQRTV